MQVGRPRKRGNEACSIHKKKLGFTYPVYVYKKSGDTYCYPRIKHNDRAIADHYIYDDTPVQYAREYNRQRKESTVFQFRPQAKFPLTQARKTDAISILIYYLRDEEYPNFTGICPQCSGICTDIHDLRCKVCNLDTIRWCPICQHHIEFSDMVKSTKVRVDKALQLKLKSLRKKSLKLKELEWLLEDKTIQTPKDNSTHAQRQKQIKEFVENLKELLIRQQSPNQKVIITYGKEAIEDARKVLRSSSFRGKIEEELDRYGVIAKIQGRRNKKTYSAR